MGHPLFDHQLDAINRLLPVLLRTGGAYIAHEVGCGKTLTALTLARLLKAQRILVVTNVPGLSVWPAEIAKWWKGCWVLVHRGQDAPVGEASGPVIVITNYQQLIGENGKKRIARLRQWGYDLLILDEAHKAKSPSSQTTRACWKLADAARYKLLLSGTPAHSPLDWWAQYRMVAPHEPMWQQRYRDYKEQVAVLDGPMRLWVTGFRPDGREAALAALLPYTHVATTAQLQLPEPITSVVAVPLADAEREAYDQMERELAIDFEDGDEASAAIVLTKLLRLHQIAAGHVTTESGQTRRIGRSKLDACLELLEERAHQKVIVACQFAQDIHDLAGALNAVGRPVFVISGRTPQETREKAVRCFQEEDRPYVLLLQYQAGGSALTLTAAQAMILYTMNYSSIDYRQMLGRAFRPGQAAHVQYLPLLAKDTVDETLYAGLQEGLSGVDIAQRFSALVRAA